MKKNKTTIIMEQDRVIIRLAQEVVAIIQRCNELTPEDEMIVPTVNDVILAAELAEGQAPTWAAQLESIKAKG